jgi:uncharacterized protein YgiM (DUF1202 family)
LLPAGRPIQVDGQAGDWLRTTEGGWVFASFFAPGESAPGSPARRFVVRALTGPVHGGPGGQYPVVGEIVKGQELVVDEVVGEWAHVRDGGWVRASLLEARQR